MKVRTIAVVLFLAAAMCSALVSRTVRSQATFQADQANVAASSNATYTPGSVSLEGVPENDQTTYTFRTDVNPPAAGGPPAGSASASFSDSESNSDINESSVVIIDDGGGGGGGLACIQPATGDAPTGFDDKTNGLIPQGVAPGDCDDPVPGTFLQDKAIFEEVDVKEDGLGPVYNAQSCKECHQNPVTGAISQITELRAGHTIGTTFYDAPGGSLINDRGIPTDNYNPADTRKSAKVQERVPPLYTAAIISGPALTADELTRTFRTSLNTLGDGFVEAIADGTLVSIANNQPGTTGNEVHGLVINVPVLEANFLTNRDCRDPLAKCVRRVGRFGWKNQHASLLSFSGDAYLNEIGITNFLIPDENTSLGRFVGFGNPHNFDIVPDDTLCPGQSFPCAEDTAQDIKTFAEFMRATKAPPRDPDIISQFQADVDAGASLFATMVVGGTPFYSCSVCHVPAIVTAPACTVINGGQFTVPAALANKNIRPFSDFLLHDIGTGDGIVQNGGQITRTMVRTPPLWGVRTRTRLMHDGKELTFNDAILRHAGEATQVRNRYVNLSADDKRRLITFLESL